MAVVVIGNFTVSEVIFTVHILNNVLNLMYTLCDASIFSFYAYLTFEEIYKWLYYFRHFHLNNLMEAMHIYEVNVRE